MMDRPFWNRKRVFVTGHTGFKGGWLASWLLDAGADVAGYALPPSDPEGLFSRCGLADRMASETGDVRDADRLRKSLQARSPEIVFHLAAQALVRRAHREPADTFAVNVLGTTHLLEAVRATPGVRAVVVVTSDKCYAPAEAGHPFREEDALGGREPYSASKACAEWAVAAYRHAFFGAGGHPAAVATARAGNVIGGGDWAEDRLVPDALRALRENRPLVVRNPGAVRSWIHVLDVLAGYLALAERLHREGAAWAEAWNFGPPAEDSLPVSEIVSRLHRAWRGGTWTAGADAGGPHEEQELRLDSGKASRRLGWSRRLSLDRAAEMTVDWYRRARDGSPSADMADVTRRQIAEYERAT